MLTCDERRKERKRRPMKREGKIDRQDDVMK